jgi:predicted RNA-binding protein YlxR (DUF448 family)
VAKPAKQPRPRHVPQRTCIGCRQEEGKRRLVRVVRTPEQRVLVDTTGKANGRGAYIHPLRTCWEKALKGGTMSHALKIIPAREDVEALRAFGMALPPEESEHQ